jgi:hypothetical protein
MSVMEWNRSCPIKCGQCCEFGWSYVPELREAYPGRSRKETCPQQSPDGCCLSREERPAACINFLCLEARNALELGDGEPHQDPEIMELPIGYIPEEKR